MEDRFTATAGGMAMPVRQKLTVFPVYFRYRATLGSSADSNGDSKRG